MSANRTLIYCPTTSCSSTEHLTTVISTSETTTMAANLDVPTSWPKSDRKPITPRSSDGPSVGGYCTEAGASGGQQSPYKYYHPQQQMGHSALPPGNWLDDIPHIQEAMADSSFNDEALETTMMEASSLQDMKYEQQSPTSSNRFSFSRTSSTGSVHAVSYSSASSAHNTDDEDSDGTMKHMSYKDRRREAHTHAEQKRRDAIKKGYEELFNLLPANQQTDSLGSQKLSKAAVLQKSIEYMKHLTSQKKKQEDQLTALQKEVTALKIMKANYELIVQTHKNAPQQGQNQVSDEVKFQVFQHVMDMLFQSFNASISVATFAELSGCVFNWLEEHCKPQNLREFTMDILSQVSTQVNNQQL